MLLLAIYLQFVTLETIQKCRNCDKNGHIIKVCKSREPPQQQATKRHYSNLNNVHMPQQARYVEGEISENAMTDMTAVNGIFLLYTPGGDNSA